MTANPKTQQAYDLMHKGVLALARAEQQGLRVDVEYAERKKVHLTRKIEYLEKKFRDTKFYRHWEHTTKGKPNINSNFQLATFLYGVKKLEPASITDSGKGSTDEEALNQLDIPELNDLLEIRKLKKVRDTYLDAFVREQVNGYVHPSFNLHLVRTYRSSSDKPNFQNIPKRDKEAMQTVRKALYPRPGHQLLEVDYSGLEVRIAACYHKDPTMMRYINNAGADMHADIAEQIFLIENFDKVGHKTLRDAAKNGFVFPEFYGDYYKNCAAGLATKWGGLPQGKWKPGQGIKIPEGCLSDHLIAQGIPSFQKFTNHIKDIEEDFWSNRFQAYAEWRDRWWETYKKYGYIDMFTGFRCSGVMTRNEVINTPIQGAAFHCLLWALIEIDRIQQEEKWDTKIIGQIHDDIVLDANPEELNHVLTVIKRVTCVDLPKAWPWIIVPLDIDSDIYPVDGSWAEKEK